MCSIAIPSELLLGHSPPVYGSLLYSSLMVTTPPIANRSVPPQIRPCLTSGSLHLAGLLKGTDDAAAANNKRNKKRVVFADDRGRPLTQVRVMSEPSNMPPLWSSAYVANLARGDFRLHLEGGYGLGQSDNHSCGINGSASVDEEQRLAAKCAELNPWEPSFAQPASDYLAFRAKLDRSSVSLENVIVRESENCLIGTVKVKNIAYGKEVAIRATADSWASHEDVGCAYVEQPGLQAQSGVRNLYDTFRFRLELPAKETGSRQLEFCVRYATDGAEFWDNNDGANYVVKKKRDLTLEEQVAELLSACCGPSANHSGFSQSSSPSSRRLKDELSQPAGEATRVHLRTWSEFASWQHLDNDSPYW